ncbi:hypothetical protein [Tenacibaculum discolor]|uniref:SnoaL-like protein n=1 Tax=Tenacibaculum discolor TaxID=361581 RepID=A0ABT9F3M1_9FLAO|nr:hypothetical protein [Tenacibaculum discolor]MDP2541311.1 hypothetical protein [Tenacibaculum discolor]
MNKSGIAKKYLEYLENGNIEKVIGLFSNNGIVESPIYGIKKADVFYRELNNDTSNSELFLKEFLNKMILTIWLFTSPINGL